MSPSPSAKPSESISPSTGEVPTASPLVEPVRQLAGAVEGRDVASAQAAVLSILQQGYSLGVEDEGGTQQNPNVPAEALSLTADDLRIMATDALDSPSRSLDYTCRFLTDVGVELVSTGLPIDLAQFLPDLQRYVDWAWANPNDPRSALGLLLCAEANYALPAQKPQLAAETELSSLAALLLCADVMIGVDPAVGEGMPTSLSFVNPGVPPGEPASGGKGAGGSTLNWIKGLITIVKPALNKLDAGVQDWVRKYLPLFEVMERLAVRIVATTANFTVQPVRSLSLESTPVTLFTCLVIKPGQTLLPLPAYYRVVLTSPQELFGQPLFPDTDVVFEGNHLVVEEGGHRASTPVNYLRADLTFSLRRISTPLPAGQVPEPRIALLYANAILPPPEVEAIRELLNNPPNPEVGTAIQTAMTLMGLTDADQVVASLIQLQQELIPSPWMVAVRVPALHPGQFPVISFAGPVQWYRQGDRGGHAAGTLTIKLDGSGVVTGNWEGEFEWEQGKFTFSGEFRGTLTPPGALGQVGDQQTHGWSLSGMEGIYTIEEYDRTGAGKQVWNGGLTVENSEMVVVTDPDGAVSTESYASLHLRLTEGDMVGDIFGWKSESAAP